MKKCEKIAAFTAGSSIYPLLEIGCRGYSHWSMALAGGVVSLLLYPAYTAGKRRCLCLRTAAVITAVEFLFGAVFNLLFHRDIWDYSGKRGNIKGQICPQMCAVWFMMRFPLGLLFRLIRRICRNLP